MAGRHRAGDPDDEAGTLPLIDGLIEAVHAEQGRAVFAGRIDAIAHLANAADRLRDARRLVQLSRGE